MILRLGQSLFLNNNEADAILLLSDHFLQNPAHLKMDLEIYREAVFTLGLANKKIGDPKAAIQAFDLYLNSGDAGELKLEKAVHYEIAIAYLIEGSRELAKFHFKKIQKGNPFPDLYAKAQLKLAQIEKSENHLREAEEILSHFEKDLTKEDPLYSEFFFHRGEIAFLMNNHPSAAEAFEKAYSQENFESVPWKAETLHYLARSYLKLAQQPLIGTDLQLLYFEKAETYFKKLLSEYPKNICICL